MKGPLPEDHLLFLRLIILLPVSMIDRKIDKLKENPGIVIKKQIGNYINKQTE